MAARPAQTAERAAAPGGSDRFRPAGPSGGVFAAFHPAAAFMYLACAVGFSMASLQPVLAALSLAGAFACSWCVRGLRRTAGTLGWAAALGAAMALANALLSTEGSTVLAAPFGRPVYLEGLAYGACAGAVLAATLLWFSSYAACMTADRSLALFGNLAPTVSLMVSQVLRLVPQFVSRGREILAVQRAVAAAAPATRRQAASDRLRAVSVLMGWGMEDSLVRGDAMRARGYEGGMRRTTYRRYRLQSADAALLAAVALLALAALPGFAAACMGFSFYPALGGLSPWRCYVPYGLLMAVPPVLTAREWLRWRRS